MKKASFLQIFIFLGVTGLFTYTFILNSLVGVTGVGALLIMFLAVLSGSWFFWAIGNKGNPDYAAVMPGTPSWRMLFYMIMFSYVLLFEASAYVLAGHNPFAGFEMSINYLLSNKEVFTILVLPLAMLIEYFEAG